MKKTPPRDEFLRKRAERQKKIRKRRIITTFIVLLVLAVCTLAVLSLTVFFPIENITVTGSSIYTSEVLKDASGVTLGDNLFITSKSGIEKRLKSRLPYVEKIKLKREIPSTLKIVVTDAEEFAGYSVNNRCYIVSESGWVLRESEEIPENLLTVVGVDVECKVGTKASFKNKKQGELVSLISNVFANEGIELTNLDITNMLELKVKVENRFEVLLGTQNKLEEKVKHLGGMIKKIDPEKKGKINISMWTLDNPQGTFSEEVAE